MAKQIEKVIYYRSILNVLDVVESCPKNLRKALKENEYQQALAILDYNSQWVGLDFLDMETRDELIASAKNPERRQHIRKIIDIFVKKGKIVLVEQILKMAGE